MPTIEDLRRIGVKYKINCNSKLQKGIYETRF